MSDRRAVKIAAGVYVALWLASVGSVPALVPCDAQNAVMAQAPTPSVQIPVKVTTLTKLKIPADRQAGDLIDIELDGTLPGDAELTWTIDGAPATERTLRLQDNNRAVGVALAGEHVVVVTGQSAVLADGAVQLVIVNASGDTGVQPPEPPKPLSELVGADAAKIAADYRALAELADTFTSAAHFWANHDALLGVDKVVLSKAAREAIEKRLAVADPLDTKALAANLVSVADELAKPGPKPDPTTPATAATYIYEERDTPVPVGVQTGINRLNREKKIIASIFDDDTRDGDGEVPDQYKAALAAAIDAGLPAFVVTAGDKVLTVVKNPTTEAQIWEAVP